MLLSAMHFQNATDSDAQSFLLLKNIFIIINN
jgi:hypothetical protein